MKNYEYFDVTADIGFKAYGNNLNEAFENAGLAMFNIISNTDGISQDKSISFDITSEDEVSLLYDYLEELLFHHEVDFMLFSGFDVNIEKSGEEYFLSATIRGEAIDWDKHERKTEIKAITFHMMDVKKTETVELQAILDL